MKASKFMMSLSAAVFGGVMYMQIAGACSRMQAAVLGTAMLVCMAICYADLQREKRRKAVQEDKARRAARVSMDKAAHIAYPRRPDEADPLMADWKKNRQKFQMPHDRVERCMRYVKAVEKDEKRAEKARKARFDALLLERWQARQANREKGNAEI